MQGCTERFEKGWSSGYPRSSSDFKEVMAACRQHNRLRIALKKHKNGLDAAAAERKFKADPTKFAYELFDESVANGSPTFDEKTAQDYFAKTYRDADRDHVYPPLLGMKRPSIPKFVFNQKCPT